MGKVFTFLLIVCTIIPCAAQPRTENFDKAIANATASLEGKIFWFI
jgi:hypothetical protein